MTRSWRSVVLVVTLWLAQVPHLALAASEFYTVQPGDTLFQIGLRFNVDWREIQQANNLTGIRIYPGQTLLIPAPSEDPTIVSDSTPPETKPPDPAISNDATPPLTHTVQRGETLGAIALRYGLTWQELAAANGLANPHWISVGQVLALPSDATPPPAFTPPAPAPAPASSDAAAPATNKRIVIDISDQHLWAYDGETEVYSFVASTGLPGLDTRPGTYSVLNKVPNAWGGNWNIWMPDWLGIYWAGSLQNGIHSLPILPDGSRLWDGYLGTPVSYGCIILGVTESKLLYDWAEVGVPVVITP